MLALESLKDINYGPCFMVHHELIPSLKGPKQGKMSSSEASSMISIIDSDKDIKSKVNKAYCNEGEIKDNPILGIIKLVIFPRFEKYSIKRPTKFGGNSDFKNYEDLEKDFAKKKVHPLDLKNSCAEYLIKICGEIRKNY